MGEVIDLRYLKVFGDRHRSHVILKAILGPNELLVVYPYYESNHRGGGIFTEVRESSSHP